MKNCFRLLMFGAIVTLSDAAMAQTTVKGILTDSIANQPVPFATVAVTKDGQPSEFAMTTITDVDGSFKGIVKQDGKYQITLQSVGKITVTKDLSISGQKTIDLGTINTADKNDTLGVVEVVALKPLVKAEAGKISYNTEADPESKTATVLDLLKKVPLVTVDGQDNISVNGSSSFQVHVNGKKNTMYSNRPSESFKAMPASTVKDIEIITDPGAKYDAEGVGGIINLITDKGQKNDQIAGTVKVGGNTRGGYDADFNIALQKNKFAMSVNGSYGDNGKRSIDYTSLGQNITYSEIQYTNTEVAIDQRQRFGEFGIQASYDVDSLNLVSVDFSYSPYVGKQDGNTTFDLHGYGIDGNYISKGTSHGKHKYNDITAGFDYQHTFKYNPMANLTFSYKVWQSYYESPSHNKSLSDDNSVGDFDFSSRYTLDKNTSGEHTFQLGYTTPINKQLVLETGLKYTLRPQHSE